MRLSPKLLLTLALCGAAALAPASPADPRSGAEYLTLPQAQNTEAGDKVEVIEFFSYACPHCRVFDPALAQWVNKNSDKIAFKRVHVAFRAAEVPLQRLYATLEAMGATEQAHAKVFAALHEQAVPLYSEEAIFNWIGTAGIDRARFVDTWRSFGMQARVNRARAMIDAYKIDSWPMLAVGGRYMTSPYMAGKTTVPPASEAVQQQQALQVMDHLLAKAKAEKK